MLGGRAPEGRKDGSKELGIGSERAAADKDREGNDAFGGAIASAEARPKGIRLRLRAHVGDVITVGLFLIIVARVIGFYFDVPTPLAVVASGSMEPTLARGDIVTWSPTRIEDVKVGDIILYNSITSNGSNLVIVHRVIEIEQNTSGPKFITKGDANEYPDQRGPSSTIEPRVTKFNFVGRVIAFGNTPIKMPLLGHVWLLIQEGILAGQAGTIVVPLGIALGSIYLAVLMVSEKTKLTRKERILEIVLGRQKIRWGLTFVAVTALFAVVVGWPTTFGQQDFGVSVGIEMPGTDAAIRLDNAQILFNITAELILQNPGSLPVRGYLFAEGVTSKFIHLPKALVQIEPGTSVIVKIPMEIPDETPKGVYVGKILFVASPHWTILPAGALIWALDVAGYGAVYLVNFGVAAIIAILVLGSYIIVIHGSERLEPRSFARHLRETFRPKEFSLFLVGIVNKTSLKLAGVWAFATSWARNIDKVPARPVDSALAAVAVSPLLAVALAGQMLAAIMLGAVFAGLVAYVTGARFRSRVMSAGLASTILMLSGALLFPLVGADIDQLGGPGALLILVIQTIGLGLLGYAVLVIPVAFLSYIVPAALQNFRERIDPGVKLLELSDL